MIVPSTILTRKIELHLAHLAFAMDLYIHSYYSKYNYRNYIYFVRQRWALESEALSSLIWSFRAASLVLQRSTPSRPNRIPMDPRPPLIAGPLLPSACKSKGNLINGRKGSDLKLFLSVSASGSTKSVLSCSFNIKMFSAVWIGHSVTDHTLSSLLHLPTFHRSLSYFSILDNIPLHALSDFSPFLSSQIWAVLFLGQLHHMHSPAGSSRIFQRNLKLFAFPRWHLKNERLHSSDSNCIIQFLRG